MRANIRISPWIPLLFFVVLPIVLWNGVDVLGIVLLLGAAVILAYVVMGLVRRQDALIIEAGTMHVTSPFRRRSYDLAKLSSISLEDGGTLLRGVYDGERVKLITAIYTESLDTIQAYLLSHHPHIEDASPSKGPMT
jgi:hypothetical protein